MKVEILFLIIIGSATANFADFFNDGEKEEYNEYRYVSEITDEINQVYQPAVDKVLNLANTDPVVDPDDPLSWPYKYVYQGADDNSREPKDTPDPYKEYDFVIVGGGTAGSVMANRLSEVKNWTVLLIEAGGDELTYMDIPLLAFNLQQSPQDWWYKSEPSDRYCNGLIGNQCNWPRGKVLGGTSVINQMMGTRGSPHDYDNWRDLGNEGWGYNDILKYFKKLETFNLPKRIDRKYHGYEGPVSIEHSSIRTIPGRAWVESAQEAGFKYVDYNAEETCGVSYTQFTLTNGTRHSANRAYLHPINERRNLHVVKGSLATKLLFDGDRSIGVVFERNNVTYQVYARKEVILSAGAINTPQILMLSGIGPREHLESLSIQVRQDLPVGRNLMDHVTVPITFTVNPDPTQINQTGLTENLQPILLEYVKYHQGPLAFPVAESIVYSNFQDNSTKAWPDIELLYAGSSMTSFDVLRRNFGFKPELYDEVYGPIVNTPAFLVLPLPLKPKSKGSITLRDSNPRSKPVCEANYFDIEEDLDVMVKGINLAIKIIEQPALKSVGAKLHDVPMKKCLTDGPFGSDAYWKCFIRAFTITYYHYSGTCKMGPADDSEAVVDPRLRVKNVEGLRVVDASIFPVIPVAHTNLPTFMVAEKAADMIKEDWGLNV